MYIILYICMYCDTYDIYIYHIYIYIYMYCVIYDIYIYTCIMKCILVITRVMPHCFHDYINRYLYINRKNIYLFVYIYI